MARSSQVTYQVLFTGTEGMTIGVQGDSFLSCMAALSDEFGDGVLLMFEDTKAQLLGTATVLADSDPAEVDEALVGLAEQIDQHEEVTEDAPRQAEPPPPPTEEQGGTQQELPTDQDRDDAPQGAERDPDPDQSQCSICGTGIEQAVANYSRAMFGDERCATCMP